MGETYTSRLRSGLLPVLTYAAYGALAAPLTIVAHELGHFGVGVILGTPDLALHYGSVSDTAREQAFSTAAIGAQALAGPIVTLLILIGGFVALKTQTHPFVVGILLASPIRFAVGAVYLAFSLGAMIKGEARNQPNFDEFNAAQAFGFAVEPLIIIEIVATIAIWVWIFRRLEKRTRFRALLGAIVGIVIGVGLWITSIGPWLLP